MILVIQDIHQVSIEWMDILQKGNKIMKVTAYSTNQAEDSGRVWDPLGQGAKLSGDEGGATRLVR